MHGELPHPRSASVSRLCPASVRAGHWEDALRGVDYHDQSLDSCCCVIRKPEVQGEAWLTREGISVAEEKNASNEKRPPHFFWVRGGGGEKQIWKPLLESTASHPGLCFDMR